MGVEFELKFRGSAEALDAIEKDAQGEKQHYHMQTTYYDTPTGALSARKYTLRRRLENDRSVCTLKFPVTEDGRGEFELDCDKIEAAVPTLCKLSGIADLEELAAEGLQPVCGADFHRSAFTLRWNGATLELALDRGKLTGGNRELPIFEVEVELKEGDPQTARAYAALCAAAYGLTPEKRSKFRRALDLAKGE